MKKRIIITIGVVFSVCLPVKLAMAQEVLLQESFETDGTQSNPPRYTVNGGDVYEVPRIRSELDDPEQNGPLYWARSEEVSVVGLAINAPARRAILTWHSSLPADAVTDDAKALLDNVIDWLAEGRASTRVHFTTGGSANSGDAVIIERLQAKGFAVTEGGTLPAADEVAFVVESNVANDNSLTIYEAPFLTYNGDSNDDQLITSIGDNNVTQTEINTVNIATPGGAAGDLTGTLDFVTGEHTFATMGSRIPEGATVTATAEFAGRAPVDNLAVVDQMISGEVASDTQTGTIFGSGGAADLAQGSNGTPDMGFNNPVPGDPVGGFAVLGTGQIEVVDPGTYTFAVGIDDGARLRIDVDGDGFSDADNVIVEDAEGAFRFVFGDATFPSAGTFDFEWTSFNAQGEYGSEIWYHPQEGGGQTGPVMISETDDFLSDWLWLADWVSFGVPEAPIRLAGNIDLTTYQLTEVVAVQRPLLVTIETGVRLLGDVLAGQQGEYFFAGAGLNKFPGPATRTLTFPPVNVAGKENLRVSFMIAGTDVDFETGDFLQVWADPDNSGAFEQVVSFNGKQDGVEPFLWDGTTQVGARFKTVTYDLPAGATDLVLELRAATTWFNEIVGFDNVRILAGEEATPGDPPLLNIGRIEDEVVVTWIGDDALEMTTAMEGEWTDTGQSSPARFALDVAPIYFRTSGNGITGDQFRVNLSGSKARPDPVDTPATGVGVIALDGSQLSLSLAYGNLGSDYSAAHIHGPADPDTAATVLQGLGDLHQAVDARSGTFSGSVELDAATVSALQDGMTYVNIHSSANPGGEIRGQITAAP